jgi:hypothetical protein
MFESDILLFPDKHTAQGKLYLCQGFADTRGFSTLSLWSKIVKTVKISKAPVYKFWQWLGAGAQ